MRVKSTSFNMRPSRFPVSFPMLSFGMLLLLCLVAPATVFSQSRYEQETLASDQEISKPSRLNNRNFQKNLEKFAAELELRPKQVRKINKIERKYSRKETKMASRPSTKRKHLRALQKEKRERMIAVLDYEQQHKLQQLSKSGFWDFLRFKDQ